MPTDADDEYEITLIPKETPPEEATDTRTYTFTSSEEKDDLVNDALTHIRDHEPLDNWALRNHWDILTITRTDDEESKPDTSSLPPDPAEQLHDALHACSYTSSALARSYTSISITIKNPRTDQWHSTTLAIKPQTKRQFYDLRRDLTNNHAVVANADPRVIHEAMVHVAANVKPSLATEFDNDPLTAQEEFVQITLAHPNKLLDEIQRLVPWHYEYSCTQLWNKIRAFPSEQSTPLFT